MKPTDHSSPSEATLTIMLLFKKIPLLLCNLVSRFCVCYKHTSGYVLSQINPLPILTLTPLIFSSTPRSQNRHLPSRISAKILYKFFIPSVHATCPANRINLHLLCSILVFNFPPLYPCQKSLMPM
jgi:hypothetical protein